MVPDIALHSRAAITWIRRAVRERGREKGHEQGRDVNRGGGGGGYAPIQKRSRG